MAGVTFDLDSAKRIVAAVKNVEGQKRDLAGAPNPSLRPGTSFWAMLTGAADIGGVFWDWVMVRPSKTMATALNPSTLAPSNMWEFADPHIAGFGNAREQNDNKGIPPGSVVLLTFVGYAVAAPSQENGQIMQGTITGIDQNINDMAGADGSIPMYAFNMPIPLQQPYLPIHDHHDNVTGGGFAFSVYHPGTSLPQQNWSQ